MNVVNPIIVWFSAFCWVTALVVTVGCTSPWSGAAAQLGGATKPNFEDEYSKELERSPLKAGEKSSQRAEKTQTMRRAESALANRSTERDDDSVEAAHDEGDVAKKSSESTRRTPIAPGSKSANNQASHMSSVAQAEYLRALDRAEITDPAERADILAALEATEPSYRAIMLRTLRAKRAPQDEARAEPQRREQRRTPSRDREEDEDLAPPPQEPPRYGSRTRTPPKNSIVRGSANARSDVFRNEPEEQEYGPAKSDAAKPDVAVRQVAYQEPAPQAKPNGVAAVAPPVTPVVDKNGREQLLAAIAALERETAGLGAGAKRENDLMRLRMLQALAGERDAALAAANDLTTEQRDFLNQQVYGLSTLLNDKENTLWSRRAAIATEHFQSATDRLALGGGLLVRNLRLCTEIKGFGAFTPFATSGFRPGQDVLIYAELDRFASENTEKGYHTKFQAGYQIWDANGRRAAERELGVAEEHCQNRRRDYFVSYVVRLPESLATGEYTLKLVVEDQLGGKIGESSLALKIDGAPIVAAKPKESPKP
ncbi:MAG: hypothetical protein QM811_16185 [Pirellulales bacterium]